MSITPLEKSRPWVVAATDVIQGAVALTVVGLPALPDEAATNTPAS